MTDLKKQIDLLEDLLPLMRRLDEVTRPKPRTTAAASPTAPTQDNRSDAAVQEPTTPTETTSLPLARPTTDAGPAAQGCSCVDGWKIEHLFKLGQTVQLKAPDGALLLFDRTPVPVVDPASSTYPKPPSPHLDSRSNKASETSRLYDSNDDPWNDIRADWGNSDLHKAIREAAQQNGTGIYRSYDIANGVFERMSARGED